jgi:hypothetical protein
MKTLQAIINKMEATEPASKEEIAFAKKIEAIRCAEVDRFYREMGVERLPEAILTRRLYRGASKTVRGLAYS